MTTLLLALLLNWHVLTFERPATDKLFFIQPPFGKHWVISAGGITIDHIQEPLTFGLWLEEMGPDGYHPYRDPITHEFIPCRCVTLIQQKLDQEAEWTFINVIKESGGPIVVDWPNRIGIAVTPKHGPLTFPLQIWTNLGITETNQEVI